MAYLMKGLQMEKHFKGPIRMENGKVRGYKYRQTVQNMMGVGKIIKNTGKGHIYLLMAPNI